MRLNCAFSVFFAVECIHIHFWSASVGFAIVQLFITLLLLLFLFLFAFTNVFVPILEWGKKSTTKYLYGHGHANVQPFQIIRENYRFICLVSYGEGISQLIFVKRTIQKTLDEWNEQKQQKKHIKIHAHNIVLAFFVSLKNHRFDFIQ